jgi:glycosyltransferase involved in cell wall biosynthesis
MRKAGNLDVAVIIPTLNEEKRIEPTLRELREALEGPLFCC